MTGEEVDRGKLKIWTSHALHEVKNNNNYHGIADKHKLSLKSLHQQFSCDEKSHVPG